ncbi:MAG: hypothetical protein JWR38_931 [Mucilaginibacter sp.]|nr:hypothetical protein [Mucilaginibacter sp.]
MIYVTLNTVSELLCFLVGLFCLANDKQAIWKLLVVYLLFTLLVEVGGIHLRRVMHTSNVMLYNFALIMECLTVSIVFYQFYRNHKNKMAGLIIWLAVFFVCYFLELLSSGFKNFVFKTTSFMSIVFVLASMYYYYLILKDEEFRELKSYAPFWWVSGTLFFYFGSTACNVFYDYFMGDRTQLSGLVRYWIFCFLDIILYGCWSYSFICRYKQRTSRRSSF